MVTVGVRFIVFAAVLMSADLLAQPQPPRRPQSSGESLAISAEMLAKQALERFGNERKAFERDLQALRHLRAADVALTDPMQPTSAVQKAFEEVVAAERLVPGDQFPLSEGVTRMRQTLEAARRSPATADFGRLRALLRQEAIGPSSRIMVRNAKRLQEETIAWLRVQDTASELIRGLTQIVGDSLRETE